MARPLASSAPETVACHGEVWTDGRGYATVSLAPDAGRPGPPLEYALRVIEGAGGARVAAELWDGRFTIETDQPHVKVAWRISGHRPASQSRSYRSRRSETR